VSPLPSQTYGHTREKPKITESASDAWCRSPLLRSQIPPGGENRFAHVRTAQRQAHQEAFHLRPIWRTNRLSRGPRPLHACPTTRTTSSQPQEIQVEKPLLPPARNPPSWGWPRDSRSWADSACQQGSTQTTAILTMSKRVSSCGRRFVAKPRNFSRPWNRSVCPRHGSSDVEARGSRSSLTNKIYTILPDFSSRKNEVDPF